MCAGQSTTRTGRTWPATCSTLELASRCGCVFCANAASPDATALPVLRTTTPLVGRSAWRPAVFGDRTDKRLGARCDAALRLGHHQRGVEAFGEKAFRDPQGVSCQAMIRRSKPGGAIAPRVRSNVWSQQTDRLPLVLIARRRLPVDNCSRAIHT